ncbi:ABC-2 transporter permease [Paenibacillus barcinonensis]|uniref:ABC-2 family transporter n=1 Tax=Paenibacillus barcinonensis TaxID=198119 RepID=A0A2V4WD33_PAEBA|nr:ABC-2 transporter permease [Paenibacillus barcinonensis]PYE45514.1 ABC-2 family transporter [Paenibacillus barcinonensis]QKS58948.1 ABC-2 transporter permease [Paenibacillus barcinonensis]
MFNLLRKDFIVLKSSLWTIALYLVVFSFAFIPSSEMSMYFVGIYTAFGSIMLATMIDIKNNNHNFLVTLPVSRKQIVKAKYLSSILYALFGVLTSYGIHKLVKLNYPELNKPHYSLLDIVISLGIVLVLVSIYMPLFYALSKKGAGIINTIFLICMIILAQPAAFLLHMAGKKGLGTAPVISAVSVAIIALFLISYIVTIRLFERKDL